VFDTLLVGLINGNTYALIALGVSLIISTSNVINFAHGSLFALGAMVGWYLAAAAGWPLWLATLGVLVITGVLGYVVHAVAVRPFTQSAPIAALLATLAVSMIFDNASQMIFGPQTRSFPAGLATDNFSIGKLRFGTLDLVMLLTSLVSMSALALFLSRHKLGQAIRATAQDREAAAQMGIPVRKVESLAFVIASMLGGLAGILIGMYYGNVSPSSGYLVGIQGFAAATLGGLGSLPGAVLGGLLLGIGEAFGVTWWGDSVRPLITFGVLLGTLWLRPGGLLGMAPALTREPLTGTFLGQGRAIRPRPWQFALAMAVAVIVLPALHHAYLLRVGSQAFAFALLAMSLTLLTGNAGQISLGQAGAVAIGAYTSALLVRALRWPFTVSLLSSGLLASALTLILVTPGWRLKGHYQSIATLAIGAIVTATILNWNGLTLGPHGITQISPPRIFGYEFINSRDYYFLNLGVLLLGGLLVNRLQASHLGRTWAAIRDDEIAARSLGVAANDYKGLAFAVGGFLAGVGGSLLAHEYGYLDPTMFGNPVSQEILIIAVLGSLTSPYGAVLGAIVLIGGLEFFRIATDWRFFIYGLLLLLLVRYRPQGLLARRA
jgi:branched-chain amino acid transport system permease protein